MSSLKRVEGKLISPDKELVAYVIGNAVIIYKVDMDPNIKIGIRVTYDDFNQGKIHDIQRVEQVLYWEEFIENSSTLPTPDYVRHEVRHDGKSLVGRDNGRCSAEHLVDELTDGVDVVIYIPDNVEFLSLSAGNGIVDMLEVVYMDWRKHVTLHSNNAFVQNQLDRMKRIF